MWLDMWTHVRICENSQLEGLYVGDLLYLFEILILMILDIYLEVGLLDHMVLLFFNFWGTSILFSIAAVPFKIPSNIVQGFQFIHILKNTC